MKAIIIGATGATGRELIDVLLGDRNYTSVSIFVRRSTNISHPKLTENIVDLSVAEQYADLIVGDILFSCLGSTLKSAGSKEVQWAIDFDIPHKFATIARDNEVHSMVLVSADGAKFKVLAQGYTLDVLLGYANKHLKDISKRYVLERVSTESLALQVVDLDMLSEVRSVHSLSGGESFLISLALALGLSSLSSNRMRVESLFIDEGFGTLDADTLRVAMDALEGLQTQGRKIGVISHVTEMTERISTQIQVVRDSNGRSHIDII